MSTFNDLKEFNLACDDLINGKYILVDLKLTSLLNTINKNEKLKNLISNCLNNTNINEILNSYISTSSCPIPTEDKELIAFVYSFFYQVKNGNVDFYNYLNLHFHDTDNSKQYMDFSNTIIIPFKNAVINLYNKTYFITESDDYQKNPYNKLKITISLILKNFDSYKLNLTDKEEFSMLLNSLHTSSEQGNKKLVYSLMIGLDYFTKCHKKTRSAYLSLEECFAKN